MTNRTHDIDPAKYRHPAARTASWSQAAATRHGHQPLNTEAATYASRGGVKPAVRRSFARRTAVQVNKTDGTDRSLKIARHQGCSITNWAQNQPALNMQSPYQDEWAV